jgi:hypothetical protein
MNHANSEIEKISKLGADGKEWIKDLYWSALDLYEKAFEQNPKPEMAFEAKIGQIKC